MQRMKNKSKNKADSWKRKPRVVFTAAGLDGALGRPAQGKASTAMAVVTGGVRHSA